MNHPIFFLTLGASDLKPEPELVASGLLEEKAFRPDRFNPERHVFAAMRHSTEQLLQHPEALGQLSYPISRPGLRFILKKQEQIERLIFVVTDQADNPEIEPYQLKGDTTFAADLIQALIEREFPNRVQSFEKIVVRRNPANFSEMYDFFDQELSGPRYAFPPEQSVYLMAQGGIDATNFALTLKCIENYPQLQQLAKPDGYPRAFVESTPQKFRTNYSKQRILRALGNFHYLTVAEEAYSTAVEKLAEFAFSCLSFDLDRAEDCTETLHREDAPKRDFYRKLDRYLDALDSGLEARLREMYLSAKMRMKQGNYADFLIKVFALTENILKPEVKACLGVAVRYDPSQRYQEWKEAINRHEGLKEYLIDYCNSYKRPNYFAMAGVVKWFAEKQDRPSGYLPFHSRFVALRDHRNKIAHGTEGVNKSNIAQSLREAHDQEVAQPIEAFFLELDAYFGIQGYGMYDEINRKIEEQL